MERVSAQPTAAPSPGASTAHKRSPLSPFRKDEMKHSEIGETLSAVRLLASLSALPAGEMSQSCNDGRGKLLQSLLQHLRCRDVPDVPA